MTFNSSVIAAFYEQLMGSTNMFTFLLPWSNSDHVMIHLGGYNCSVCIYSHLINLVCKLCPPNESSRGLNCNQAESVY